MKKKLFKYYLEKKIKHSPFFLITEDFSSDFLDIKNNEMIAKRGWKWDGCSPKIEIMGLFLGTPDGIVVKTGKNYLPISGRGSCFHDLLWHYKKSIRISRIESDLIAFNLWVEDGFLFSFLFFHALQIFSLPSVIMYGSWPKKECFFSRRIMYIYIYIMFKYIDLLKKDLNKNIKKLQKMILR